MLTLAQVGASIVRYGPIAQGFHWITALLVLAAFLISAGGPERIVYSPERSGQLLTHETLVAACVRVDSRAPRLANGA